MRRRHYLRYSLRDTLRSGSGSEGEFAFDPSADASNKRCGNRCVRLNAPPVRTRFWRTLLLSFGYKNVVEFRDGINVQPEYETERHATRSTGVRLFRQARTHRTESVRSLDKADKPKRSLSRIEAFPVNELQKLLRYVEGPGSDPLWRALLLFGFDSGTEPEEFLGLQVGDFDLKTGYVHIQRTCVEAGGEIIVKPDMKADSRNRRLPLADRTLKSIAALLGHGIPHSEHVFSPNGKPWSYDAFIKLWRKLLVAAEVGHLPPLSMRHTMATMMLSRGEPIAAVSKRLGHANIVTTLTHYVHAMPSDTERLGRVTSDIYNELLGPS